MAKAYMAKFVVKKKIYKVKHRLDQGKIRRMIAVFHGKTLGRLLAKCLIRIKN